MKGSRSFKGKYTSLKVIASMKLRLGRWSNCGTFDSQFPLVLSEYLKGNCKLKELVWDKDALQTSHFLTPLHLTTDQFITLLAPALQANHTVTHLNMRKVGVGDVEAKALGKILQSNHTLTHLCLAVNEITPVGVEALADALRSNKILEDLNIEDNVIDDEGAEALGKVLQSIRL